MRESILMYKSHCDALRGLPAEQFKAAVTAIWDYAIEDKAPEGDPVAVAMVGMVKPLIDKNNQRYINGKHGGRPKNQVETKPEPSDNQTETKEEPNRNQTEPSRNLKDKGERIKDKYIDISPDGDMSGKPAPEYPYKEVIDYLNQKAGTAFKDQSKDTRRHIKARIDEGFTLDDFKRVIDGRVAEWKADPRMCQYIRPQTLFGTKFESYLNAKQTKPKRANGVNFTGREYDFDSLEKQLLNAQRGVAS